MLRLVVEVRSDHVSILGFEDFIITTFCQGKEVVFYDSLWARNSNFSLLMSRIAVRF